MITLIWTLLMCVTTGGMSLVGFEVGARAERQYWQRRAAKRDERVREAANIADAVDVTDWQRGYRACAERVHAALGQCAKKEGSSSSSSGGGS